MAVGILVKQDLSSFAAARGVQFALHLPFRACSFCSTEIDSGQACGDEELIYVSNCVALGFRFFYPPSLGPYPFI